VHTLEGRPRGTLEFIVSDRKNAAEKTELTQISSLSTGSN